MPDDEVRVSQEVFVRKRTNWHRFNIAAIYQNPEAYRLKNYSTHEEMIVTRNDFKTELPDVPWPAQKRAKKKPEPDLFSNL